MSYLIAFLGQILTWIVSFFTWCLIQFFDVVGAALITVFDALPVPSFVGSASTSLAALPPGVLYFSQALDLSTGVSVVLTAYLLRFLIRRIPIIG